MKKLILFAVFFFGFSMAAFAASGDAILGLWATEKSEKGQAHVDIVWDGETYSGTIVWLEKPTYPMDDEKGMGGQTKVDRENPDPQLRDRPTLGLKIVAGFKYDGEGNWKGGTIYDPANGKTYQCKMRLADDGLLKVRGFIGISLLGRTANWTRVISN